MTRILLSNDDGYQALGLMLLFEKLKALSDVDVEVLAPETNNSAKSNALTVNAPLYIYPSAQHERVRYVTGTPADCVHLALSGVLDYRPDLVVSGINNGANMGDDTLYSGTVGAAMEGYLFGIPAIAFSLAEYGWRHIETAAAKAAEMVCVLLSQGAVGLKPWLLNVNIPALPHAQVKPPRVCRLGKRHAAEAVTTLQSPKGQTMYWIGAAGAALDGGEGTDFHAVEHGHIAVTPLQIDLTDHDALRYWAQNVQAMA